MTMGIGVSYQGSFDPSSVVVPAAQGFWYDPSDLSTLFKDSAGTTPAVVDDVVGLMRDKSGHSNHVSQSTTASKPILRFSSGRYYLEADGVDDYMISSNIAWGSDAVTLVAGIRKLRDSGALEMIMEFSATTGSNNGSFGIFHAAASQNLAFAARGTTLRQPGDDPGAAAVSAVVGGEADVSSQICNLFLNSLVKAASSGDLGTGTMGTYPLYLFRRGGSSAPFQGQFYGAIGYAATSEVAITRRLKSWMAAKSGLSL